MRVSNVNDDEARARRNCDDQVDAEFNRNSISRIFVALKVTGDEFGDLLSSDEEV
jgi:hypothetical protein